jgi:hypothetical protein
MWAEVTPRPLFIGILNFSVSPMAIRESSFNQLWTSHVG